MNILNGIVVSVANAKTAKVAVTHIVAHPIYKKRVKRTRNYLVHDEVGVTVGSHVQFVACRPISKLKRWKIVDTAKKTVSKEKVSAKPKKVSKK